MAALPSQATSPNPLYILLDGGQYVEVKNSLLRTQVDVENYDGSTYRRIVDASMLGNPHSIVTQQETSQAAGSSGSSTPPTPPTTPTATAGASSSSVGVSFSTNGKSVVLAGAQTSYDPVVNADSAFRVESSDTVPGITAKRRTLIQWWDAASNGNVVGQAWFDEIRGWSGYPPLNLN